MNCIKCGALIPDDSDYCPKCGTTTQTNNLKTDSVTSDTSLATNEPDKPDQDYTISDSNNEPKPETPKLPEKHSLSRTIDAASLVGIITGILFAVAGLIIMTIASPGCEVTSFGGDAYTFIYQGIVAIANSVALITRAVGGCLTAIGVFMACFFWGKLRS